MPIAAARAGALGVISLEFGPDREAGLAQLRRLGALGRGRAGALIDDREVLESVLAAGGETLDAIVLANLPAESLGSLVESVHAAGLQALVVAGRLEEALAAEQAGADAVIAKGHEAGGWIGERGRVRALTAAAGGRSQRRCTCTGGSGCTRSRPPTSAGAAGAVLDGQLLLARESPLAEQMRAAVAAMDGSETAVLGAELGAPFRAYSRPGLRVSAACASRSASSAGNPEPLAGWRGVRQGRSSAEPSPARSPPARAGRRASPRIWRGASAPWRASSRACGPRSATPARRSAAATRWPRARPLAQSHGTAYPIVQGPMTRVSDRAEFAAAVAEAGALPFLALALMRAPEADALLAARRELLGERPWGVGILGFVPPELRAEQLEVVRAHRPPFALIAGGRPDQARELEADGIATYLHVPSPGLLKLYLARGRAPLRVRGARVRRPRRAAHELRAVGHDDAGPARGAAARRTPTATSCSPAASTTRGRPRWSPPSRPQPASAGSGSASCSAPPTCSRARPPRPARSRPLFQEAAIAASDTVLLESGPGHATRCLPLAVRRALRGRAAPAARGRGRRRGAARAARGAEHRPAADRREGRRPASAGSRGAPAARSWSSSTPSDAVGAGHVHDRPGRGAAQRGDDARRAARRRSRRGQQRAARGARRRPSPSPSRRRRRRRDIAIIGIGCILPGAPDASDLLGEHPRQGRRDHRGPRRALGLAAHVRPRPGGPRQGLLALGRLHRPRAVRPDRARACRRSRWTRSSRSSCSRCSCAQAALDDAGYATRPFDRERTSVILGAGGGGADLAVGYTVRSAFPSLLGDASPELQGAALRPAARVDRGQLRRPADERRRRADRQPARPRRHQLHRRRGLRLLAGARSAWPPASCRSGTSDMALAGGVDAIQNPFAYLCFAKTHALSPAGRCRPFDADRRRDRDQRGVRDRRAQAAGRRRARRRPHLRGDPRRRRGERRARPQPDRAAARGPDARAAPRLRPGPVLARHGRRWSRPTAPARWPATEPRSTALSTVFAEHSDERQWCAIGSVKSMIGHTKATAGVAGMIKAALALHHRVLPPTHRRDRAQPEGRTSPRARSTSTAKRGRGSGTAPEHPRRAGVSAFGFGGTDFHVVLEEYTGSYLEDVRGAGLDGGPPSCCCGADPASGCRRRSTALDRRSWPATSRRRWRPRPSRSPARPPAQTRRRRARDRRRVARGPAGQARQARESCSPRAPPGVHDPARDPLLRAPAGADGQIAFLFPGQGSQTGRHGTRAGARVPRGARAVRAGRPRAARTATSGRSAATSSRRRRSRRRTRSCASSELTDTHVAQPALGRDRARVPARARALWASSRQLTAGHSYGEFVALAAAGALDPRRSCSRSPRRAGGS